MKVVFPNSAWVRAMERLILLRGRFKSIRLKVRYGIVLHPGYGPVLIDTGYTDHTVSRAGRSALLRLYARILSPMLNTSQQPLTVLKQMGFGVEDVKFIIVTHFHADHVSGLREFPNARFIVDGDAWTHVNTSSTATNLRHGVFTDLLPDDFGDRTIALGSCPHSPRGYDIFGDGRLLAVPLPGHAAGHFGVWIDAAPAPILYAVDAQWLRQAAVEGRAPRYPARVIMSFRRDTQIMARYRMNDWSG